MSAAAPSHARVGVREQRGPYQGLAPYAEEDAPFFFGRDGERDIVIANLLASRLTVVYGTSGVGKTSLLRAGVAHRLRERGRDRLARGGRPELLVVVFDAWRDDPVAGIEAATRAAAADLFGAGVELGPAPGRLATRLHRWTGELSCDLLVILDQTEEYFLYHAGEDGEGTFAVEFPRAVNAPDLAVNFLLSIREDALSRLDRFKSRVPGLLANLLRVQHLDLPAARSAIQDPLDEYNRRVPGGQPWSIEPELVELVLDELRPGRVVLGATGQGAVDQAAGRDHRDRRVETPFLQLVMTQLWTTEAAAGSHVMRAATLGRLGGAKEIVRSHLDQAMQALGPDERDVAARIFHYLVAPSGSKVAFTAADLAGWAELPEARIEPLLERLSLSDTRVVRPVGPAPDGSGGTRYEVFHDVLAPAVLEWRAKHVAAQTAEEAAQVAEERLHQARRKTRRLTGFVIALGALLLVAVASALAAVYQGNRADAQRRRAVSYSMVAQAEARATDQPDLSILLSLTAYELQQSDEARGSAMLQADRRRDAGALLTGAAGVLSGAAFSPDGRLFAAGDTSGMLVWEVTGRRQPALLTGGGGRVRGVAFSPDGRLVVAAGDDGVEVWGVSSRHQLALLAGGGGGVRAVAFSPDGRLLAAGYKDGVRLWDVRARRRAAVLARRGGADSLAFGADGRTLASASSSDAKIAIWDVAKHRLQRTLQGHQDGGVRAIALSPDGGTLVSAGSADGTMRVWNLASGDHEFLSDEQSASAIVFRPDGRTVATVNDDSGKVELWDVPHLARLRGLAGNVGPATAVAFSPDGRTLASCGSDRTVALFDLPPVLPVGNDGFVNTLAFSPDGGTVATAGLDGRVVLWDARTRAPRATLSGHEDQVTGVAFAPDGRILASAGLDGRVVLWDVERRTPLRVPGFDATGAYKLAFSPKGGLLALAGYHGTVTLWDTRRWARLAVLKGHEGQVTSVAFDPQGRRLASGGADGLVAVWDVASHDRLADLAAHTDAVNRVVFSPDGKALASASDDGVAIVWDLGRRTPTATFPGLNIAFSPDGGTVATLQPSGGRIVLWDLARRIPTGLLVSGAGLTFSPDGRLLATVGDDFVLHDLSSVSWRRQLCALAGRDLTDAEWNLFASGVRKRAIC